MGFRRGSFENTSITSSVGRAKEHSTIRPDEGVPLRMGAKALDSWANAFGKMAQTASRVKAVQQQNANTQSVCKEAAMNAATELQNYKDMDPSIQNKEELANLEQRANQMNARYRASMTLGVFSNEFDMNKDYAKAGY